MAEVINQYRVGGTDYVQYEGKSPDLWWVKGAAPNDGTAHDTGEIEAIAKRKAQLYKDREKIDDEIEETVRELKVLETLHKQRAIIDAR